jgi:hypothetical protein
VRGEVYDALPARAKPLFAHWVDRDWEVGQAQPARK